MKIAVIACFGLMYIHFWLASPVCGDNDFNQQATSLPSQEQIMASEKTAFSQNRLHVYYLPFVFCSHMTLIPIPDVSADNTKPLTFSSSEQLHDFQLLLYDQTSAGKLGQRRLGEGQYGTTCLLLTIDDSGYRVAVDEKGQVRCGTQHYRISKGTFLKLDHLLNGLWFAQNPKAQKYISKDRLDLTPKQLGR